MKVHLVKIPHFYQRIDSLFIFLLHITTRNN